MTNAISRRVLLAVTAAATAVALAACSPNTNSTASASSAAAPAAIVVATNAAFAPFEYVAPSGQLEGFDIELIQAVADKGGFQIKLMNTPWEGIFNALENGEAAVLASGVTITDERRASMDFSAPYYDAVQLIALRPDSTIASFDALKDGVLVGVLNGSTGDEVVSKLLGKTNANIKRFDALAVAMQELEAGGIGAVVGDNSVLLHHAAQNRTNVKWLPDLRSTVEQYGFVVKKGNAELLGKINAGLQAIRADGTYDKIYAKWFGDATVHAAPAASAAASH